MAVSVVQALGRRLDAPRVARAHVRDFLLDLDSADLVADVELVVSELVTNAVLHGTGQVQLRLEMVDGAVSVGVLDGGRAQPRPPGRGHGAESGRGLALVAGLTRDWGIRPDSTGGKEVWAVFPPEPTS
jgi:anti-sigma regulatory factor (Ser/Thr protein kinase)